MKPSFWRLPTGGSPNLNDLLYPGKVDFKKPLQDQKILCSASSYKISGGPCVEFYLNIVHIRSSDGILDSRKCSLTS